MTSAPLHFASRWYAHVCHTLSLSLSLSLSIYIYIYIYTYVYIYIYIYIHIYIYTHTAASAMPALFAVRCPFWLGKSRCLWKGIHCPPLKNRRVYMMQKQSWDMRRRYAGQHTTSRSHTHNTAQHPVHIPVSGKKHSSKVEKHWEN